jgi:hypothetical protein
VDPGVTGEFVGSGETLVASWMCARVWLLSGVRADVTGLHGTSVAATRRDDTGRDEVK